MPVDMLSSQQGIFLAVEAERGSYGEPGAAAYVRTSNLKISENQGDKKTLNMDGLGRACRKTALTKRHHKISFDVPLSWSEESGSLLAVHPLLLTCGASDPVDIDAPYVGRRYVELDDPKAAKTASINYRRRVSSTEHYERRIVGAAGDCKFEWKMGEIPKFIFEYLGVEGALRSSDAIVPNGACLSNIAQPSNALNTGHVLIGGHALCLEELSVDSLWRTKASVYEELCGTGVRQTPSDDAAITIVAKHPNINTEFNPDALLGNSYGFTTTLWGDGALSHRKLILSWADLEVLDVGSSTVNGLVYMQLKLQQNSPTILQSF